MKNFNAICYMYPGAKFSMINDDISTIIWEEQSYPIPTTKQLNDTIKEMEDKETQNILDKLEAKKSAFIKLQSLGLTEDEAKAIAGL